MYTSKQISEKRKTIISEAVVLEKYFEGHNYLIDLSSSELELYEKYQNSLQKQAALLQTLYSLARRKETANVTKTKINS